MTATEQAVAEALWRNIDEDFTVDKSHEAFIAHCRQCQDLAFAAKRYRERMAGARQLRPAEAAQAEQQLQAIAALAMTDFGERAASEPPGGGLKRAITVVGVLFFLAALGVLLWALTLP